MRFSHVNKTDASSSQMTVAASDQDSLQLRDEGSTDLEFCGPAASQAWPPAEVTADPHLIFMSARGRKRERSRHSPCLFRAQARDGFTFADAL